MHVHVRSGEVGILSKPEGGFPVIARSSSQLAARIGARSASVLPLAGSISKFELFFTRCERSQ